MRSRKSTLREREPDFGAASSLRRGPPINQRSLLASSCHASSCCAKPNSSFDRTCRRHVLACCGNAVQGGTPVNSVLLGRMVRQRPPLSEFLAARLGPGSPGTWVAHMFSRSFTAPSFRAFWRYWNPVYGYALLYFCYIPIRAFAPKTLCLVATFVFSGFVLHDLPVWAFVDHAVPSVPFPVVTVAFALLALLVLVSESFGLTLGRLRPAARIVCHGGAIGAAFAVSVFMFRLIYRHAA